MYTQINITSYRIGPWAGRLPLRLISVAVMEATQQGENKYNVATDHQAKQNKTKHHIQNAYVCVHPCTLTSVTQLEVKNNKTRSPVPTIVEKLGRDCLLCLLINGSLASSFLYITGMSFCRGSVTMAKCIISVNRPDPVRYC